MRDSARHVDQSVEAAKPIDLRRYILCARDGLDVADHDRLGLGKFPAGRFSALAVASVKHDAVAFAGEQIGRHQAEAGGRTRNEDA